VATIDLSVFGLERARCRHGPHAMAKSAEAMLLG
jgi:hypothetical protein